MSFADHPKAEQWSDRNQETPAQVAPKTKRKYWFDCTCGHSFKTALGSIKLKETGVWIGWCPYCRIPARKLCTNEDCEQCFENSLAAHPKSKFWDHKKNDTTPRKVLKMTTKKYWFNCACGHDVLIDPGSINRGRWCKYCCVACVTCFNKSFACHARAGSWMIEKNKEVPRNVALNAIHKKYFKCAECAHEFQMAPHCVGKGRWCPYCAHHKLCSSLKCDTCFSHSFASQPKSKFWDPVRNKKTSREVFRATNTRYWFICESGNSFSIKLSHISEGRWCSCTGCLTRSR